MLQQIIQHKTIYMMKVFSKKGLSFSVNADGELIVTV